jgi:hypothetical protein
MNVSRLVVDRFAVKFVSSNSPRRASLAALGLIALAIGPVMLPGTARATVQLGSFAGTLNNNSSSDFTSDGFTSNANDAITGTFSFDTSSIPGSFTATIFDVNSNESFTLPAGFASAASANATATNYTATGTFPLEFVPTSTDFTAIFSIDLTGAALVPGALGQTALFTGGTGSLEIQIPTAPDGPVDQIIGFTVTSASVPEPASIGLLGFALAGLAGMRRRRAKG